MLALEMNGRLTALEQNQQDMCIPKPYELWKKSASIIRGKSKHTDHIREITFDLVITVCSSAAKNCPVWLSAGRVIPYSFNDPAAIAGSEEEIMVGFRQVRDDINKHIPQILRNINEA